MLLEKEYNDLGHEPDNVYSSNSNDEHSTHDFNTSFTRDVSEDNDSKDTDVPSNNPSKSEDELSDKEELADEYFQDKPPLEKPSESYRNFKEKRHRSLNTHEMLHPPTHQKRDWQGSLYDRRRQFPYNFAPVQNMHHNYSNCKLAIYNNTSRYDKKYVSNRIRRDFQDLESDNESLHNELQILGDACENIYNIENRSRSRRVHGDRYKGPSNKESYRVSSHFDHNQPLINNYLIYYLKEEAIKESERLRNLIYESKSFSPDANKVKFIKKIKKDKDELIKLKKKTKSTKKKKKNKPIELEESDTVAERTTEEMEISENIESFADFSDSMFTFKIKDKIKIYKCPYLGCLKELPSLSRIKRHYLVHTNLKPFKCLNSSCNKRFSRKDNMLQHFRTHCGSKKKKHSF